MKGRYVCQECKRVYATIWGLLHCDHGWTPTRNAAPAAATWRSSTRLGWGLSVRTATSRGVVRRIGGRVHDQGEAVVGAGGAEEGRAG